MPILGNTATKLKLGYHLQHGYQNDTADENDPFREYAIVSMPIDEVFYTGKIFGASFGFFLYPDMGNSGDSSYKEIIKNPVSVHFLSGANQGQLFQISGITPNMAGALDSTRAFTVDDTGHISEFGFPPIQLIRSRFPISRFVKSFRERTLWISDTTFGNSFWWSEPGHPGFVKPNNYSVVAPTDGEIIRSCWTTQDAVYFGKETKLYALLTRTLETTAEDPAQWQIAQISASVGCESPKSIVQRGNDTWFFDWPQGFYNLNGNELKKISEPIRPIIDSIPTTAKDKTVGVYYPSKKGDLILWAIPINGSTKCNRILSYSPSTQAWGTWDITNTDSLRIASALVQEGAGDAGELLLGLADSGYVLRYNPDGNRDTLDGQGTGLTKTFTMTAESKRFELPGQRLRFADGLFKFNVGGAATVNFDFYKNLSTASLQTIAHSATTGDNDVKKSFSDALIGNQLAWRISTVSAQTFKLAGVDITVKLTGRRTPE
jgi:hypothetical protein